VILVLLTLIGIPTLLLNSSRFQQRLLDVATKEFKQRTGATMTVYDSEISLFKGIVFHVVRIQDAHSKPVLNAERIDVGLEVLPLFQNKIKIRNLRLIRANVYLSRLSPDSPLNIQPILDGLKSKKQKAKGWDIQLSSIVLRNCRVHYDVQSVPVSKKNYNWSHLDIQDISTRMAFRLIQKNHYSFWIYQLQAREKGGLRIDQLNTFGQITEKSLHLDHLSLHSGRTSLEIDGIKAKCKLFEKQATSLDSIILGSTNIRISLHPSDFAYFSSSLSNLDKQVDLSILMQGRFSNLNIKNLSINMQNMVTASGKFVVQNLRDLDNLNIQGSIKQLRINPAGMDYLAAHLTAKNFNSTILKNLGTLEYAGLVRTINKQWIVTGDFATAAGKINTDIHIGKKGFDFLYEGRIKSDSFKLQTLLPDNKDLGETAFDVSINGISKPGTGFSGKVDGSIPHIQYRGYDFLHLSLNGAFNKKGFEGEAKLDDLNGKLHFIGLIDFAETMPIYRFDLYAEGFNPFALGLMGYNNGSDFAFHLHSDFKGHHLDDLTGKLTVDSLSLYSGDQTFYLKHLELVMLRNLENQQILIASPILNGELWGNFQLSTLGDGIQGLLKSYFPSLSQKNYTGLRGNTYDFHLSVAPSPELFSILKLPFNLTETAEIRGFYNENTGKFRLRGDIPSMTYGKIPVESAGVLLENPQKEAKFLAFAEVGKDDKQMKINLDARGLNDFASIRFNMSNSAVKTYSGNLQGDVRFSRSAAGNLRADANLKPSSLMVNDSLWHILPTSLILEHKSLYVEAFELNHSDQFIKINGIASEKTSDTLHVALNSFSLDDIFALLPSTNRNLHLGGAITGKAQCVSLLGNPSMDADLQVKHFSFNHTLLGNLTAKSIWDNNLKAVVLDAAVYTESTSEKGSALLALSKGKFFPTKDSLYISVDGNRLPIGFLKPYLGKILDNMDGLASGKVQILGPTKHLAIYADAYMENTSFGVKMLHTRYTFSDSIHLTPSVIYFRNTLLRDKEGNTAVANGIIRHRYFKNMQTSIDIVGKNILAMDLPADPSAYFYGTAYGTGTVSVNGPQDDIVIDVNLKSEPKTNVTISFLDDSDVAEAGFIHFVQKKKRVRDDVDEEPFRKKRQPQPITTSSNVTVNLQLEATPAAELTLITDPNSGDEIRAKGSGALRCVISGKEDIQLFGRYDIESGSYKFIYENLLRRDFKIENGGSITFAGNPFAAQLDVTANYTVNAQLSDLLTSDDLARLNLNRSSIPVNCVLKLNGELQRPGITLDLAYPSADDELKRSITNVINTEDLLNQQLVFLMLFGRFNTTSYSTAQTNSSTNNMSTVWNTGISTLSSQLNRMINSAFGQTNMTFNLNYQNSSYDATTPGEWGVAMSGQFFNNRLTVNGNVGSRENLTAGSSNQFIGEFDADLKFKNSEKWRWKFFNRANDNRYLKSALNTQGAGISFKEDYNTIGELFRKMFGTRKDTTTTKKKTPKEKKQKTAQK
jgi:hypothetical protein